MYCCTVPQLPCIWSQATAALQREFEHRLQRQETQDKSTETLKAAPPTTVNTSTWTDLPTHVPASASADMTMASIPHPAPLPNSPGPLSESDFKSLAMSVEANAKRLGVSSGDHEHLKMEVASLQAQIKQVRSTMTLRFISVC